MLTSSYCVAVTDQRSINAETFIIFSWSDTAEEHQTKVGINAQRHFGNVSTKCLSRTFFCVCVCFSGQVTSGVVSAWIIQRRMQPVRDCLWLLVAESVWRLRTHHPAASNIQQAASTRRSNPSRLQSCSQAFNKQRKWHITPSLSLKSCTGERKKTLSSYLTNTSLFEVQTRKNEGPFFRACTPYDSNLGVLCILAQACGLW